MSRPFARGSDAPRYVVGIKAREKDMLRLGVVAALVGSALAVAACNTVRGAAQDVNSLANCTENTINTGRCK